MEERIAPLNFPGLSVDEAKVVAATGTQPSRPERFGRYLLLDRIGSGGMAEVYRAVMPGAQGFRQTFVVKRILAERSRAPDFVDMFVQEARIGALLSHPNIVQVFDFGNVGGDYFLAMEYLRGRDVQAVMRKLREQERALPGAGGGVRRARGRGLPRLRARPDRRPTASASTSFTATSARRTSCACARAA